MGPNIVYICCIEFQTFKLINCSVLNILTDKFSEILNEPINVGLSVKILNIINFNTRHACVLKD